jgi:GntR family transcriptional regulator / MocR family aminotransferase
VSNMTNSLRCRRRAAPARDEFDAPIELVFSKVPVQMKEADQSAQLFASTVWRLVPGEATRRSQIYRQLRDAVTGGRLAAGMTIPPSRPLARALGIARSTLMEAFDQLRLEGYLEARQGAATHVARLQLRHLLGDADRADAAGSSQREEPTGGHWALDDPPTAVTARAFRPGLPDIRLFPAQEWASHIGRRSRRPISHDLSYASSTGVASLREQIARHVSETRHVVARPQQVIVLPSAQSAFDVVLRCCTSAGQTAWLEDPGYPGMRTLARGHQLRIEAVPVDGEGLRPSSRFSPPQLIYLTPSHQYPTGATLSLNRRLELLDLAHAHRATIIEDDFDSEFVIDGQPIASLQGLDRDGCVYYVGTFSKTLAPGLRCAYLIVPPGAAARAETVACAIGAGVPIHVQLALADFMADGGLRRHIHRMRGAYAARLQALQRTLREDGRGLIVPTEFQGGIQLCAALDPRFADVQAATVLDACGLTTVPISTLSFGEEWRGRQGLLLGVGLVSLEEVVPQARRLCKELLLSPH